MAENNNPNAIPELDVVVSSRVRLARNYEDLPFSSALTEPDALETVRRATKALDGEREVYRLVRMAELSEEQRTQLVERHLVSYDLLKFAPVSAALLNEDDSVSVMVNEEDHLRIQGLMPGLQLEHAAAKAFQADDALAAVAPYAFDAQWGYLTSCPTNTGTGMRASTMLHLCALTVAGQMGAIVQVVSKLGLTVRGLYGEGSDAQGCLYQLSNQVTLGRTEADMVKSLNAATLQIAGYERAARQKLLKKDPVAFMDKLMRSVGILAHARILTQKEFMQRASDLRLAAGMGVIAAKLLDVDRAVTELQNASLAVQAGKALSERERNILRADTAREQLRKIAQS